MKKLITTLMLTASTAVVLAQGTINYNNGAGTQYQTNSLAIGGNASGNFAGAAGLYYFDLLIAPSTTTAVDASLQNLLSAPWTDTGLAATNTGALGRMNGGSGVAVPGWTGGTEFSYIVVGWSANLGTSWATLKNEVSGASLVAANGGSMWTGGTLPQAASEFLGASSVGTAFSGGGTFPTYSIFNSGGASAQGTPISTTSPLWVVSVPEPTTFALAGLGAAALMVMRRRK